MKHAIILLLFTASVASAHGLLVKPVLEGDFVRIAVSYDDGTPAKAAKVQIVTASGEELSHGTTDELGIVELPRPAEPRGCKIKVDAGDGHARTVAFPTEGVQVEEPSRVFRTILGLAIIAAIAVLLRIFWPKTPKV